MITFLWIILVSDELCREIQYIYITLNNSFPKIVRLWDNVEKCGGAREAILIN
jgi:hypothetical protein